MQGDLLTSVSGFSSGNGGRSKRRRDLNWLVLQTAEPLMAQGDQREHKGCRDFDWLVLQTAEPVMAQGDQREHKGCRDFDWLAHQIAEPLIDLVQKTHTKDQEDNLCYHQPVA